MLCFSVAASSLFLSSLPILVFITHTYRYTFPSSHVLATPCGGRRCALPPAPPSRLFFGGKVLPSSLSSLLCLFACYVLSLLFTFSLSLSDVLNASSNKEFLSISLMPSSLQNYIFTAFRCRVALWTAQLETKHSSYIFGTVLSTKSISSSLMHLRISSLCVIPSHFSFHHLHA